MAKTVIMRQFHCTRCRRKFMSAQRQPRTCAKCKSRYWNLPRVRARQSKSPALPALQKSPVQLVAGA